MAAGAVAEHAAGNYNRRMATADVTRERRTGHLSQRGLYWRSVSALLVFQALCWGGAAGLGYLIISPELAKDYFSAHSTVKAARELVAPALAVSAAVGFLVAGIGSALSLRSHSRRLLEPLRQIDELLRGISTGNIPRPALAPRSGLADQAAAHLEPLFARVGEFQRIARDLQKISLELNYRAAGSEITLRELRTIATQIDALIGDLARTAGWFKG